VKIKINKIIKKGGENKRCQQKNEELREELRLKGSRLKNEKSLKSENQLREKLLAKKLLKSELLRKELLRKENQLAVKKENKNSLLIKNSFAMKEFFIFFIYV